VKFNKLFEVNSKNSNFSLDNNQLILNYIKTGYVKMIHLNKINQLIILWSIFCISCSTEPVEHCDYKNDDISYDCIQGIFDLSCMTYGNCHTVGGNIPNLSYGVSYNNIIGKTATWSDENYIEPFYPSQSLLYKQLEQSVSDNRYFMPLDGNKLSKEKRDYIYQWIEAGAPLN
tara:strand:- start:1486 stop:2004 length:519 start_codon:yes stop_codon:yes gene_type:complete